MPDITRRNFRQYDRDQRQAGLISPTTPAVSRTALLLIANRGYYGRFVPSRNMRIVSMSYNVTIAATNDDPVDVGIFNGACDTLLGSAGATVGKLNTTTGLKNVTLLAPVNLTAGTVYYAGLSCGAVGGTAASVEVAAVNIASGCDFFGTTAPTREFGIKASAHPLAASVVLQATTSTPVLALIEG